MSTPDTNNPELKAIGDEPAPGLPAHLPAGEKVLWQGRPDVWSLAVHAFHARKVAIYFAILCAAKIIVSVYDGERLVSALRYIIVFAPFALAAVGILALIARAQVKATVYTITSRRVVIRSGVAMDVTVNLPFARIDAAGMHVHGDGTGDIPLRLNDEDRIAILAVWPHMRPWRWNKPQPMLRSLPDPERVAKVLASALAGAPVTIQSKNAQIKTNAAPSGESAPDLRPAT
jgi:hypothetical protein